MGQDLLLLIQVFFPVVAGCLLFLVSRKGKQKIQKTYITAILVAEIVLVAVSTVLSTTSVECFRLTSEISLLLCNDGLSKFFCILVTQ